MRAGRPGRGRDARADPRGHPTRASPPPSSTASAARCSTGGAPRRTSSATTAIPAVICASPNDDDRARHPRTTSCSREGDIISIDCGAIVDGWHGDAAFTAASARSRPRPQRLIDVTEASLHAGIAADGGRAAASATSATPCSGWPRRPGSRVVREYIGHAIGQAMHEQPEVPNYGRPGTGPKLRVGNVFAVEPMVNAGSRRHRPARRRLERGDRRRPLVGPRRAHHRHHRRRPRDPHPAVADRLVGRQPAQPR